CVVYQGETHLFPLPVCGLMTDKSFEQANEDMVSLQKAIAATGAQSTAFMTLSFMGLTVIPHLKITPRGLFDGDAFGDVTITW
ncbi:MAG TPA: adenine deaminase, partial [Methanocorpusculum sp.]|nr:adenine deaminase [Methanocorpusculum sp.]